MFSTGATFYCFEHGCLREVIVIHRGRICRRVIYGRVCAYRDIMYTDFSAIKEKGNPACRQYFLSFALNKGILAWSVYSSLAYSLL